MNRTRIATTTLGCKLNYAETSSLFNSLGDGFEMVDFGKPADYYIIHSCTVTTAAEKKCRNLIRQAKRQSPDSKIVVMGCMSQLRASELSAMPEVNYVLGNNDKFLLKQWLLSGHHHTETIVRVSDISGDAPFFPVYSAEQRTRMFIKIQDGCNYYCSYCTIPFARGRSRSDTVDDTLKFINQAVIRHQPKEIVLTGVNIGDFGRVHKESLYDLLLAILDSVHIPRIRLSSIEPDLLEYRLIKLVSENQRIMPHFHIPLQSGSNMVLQRMKRRYSVELFRELVGNIRSAMSHAFIAADVIAGFPGESQEEFEETMQVIQEMPLSCLHVFPYSPRPGTIASNMSLPVLPQIVKNRVTALLTLSDKKLHHFNSHQIGSVQPVLFESSVKNGFISGFTPNYIRARMPFRDNMINEIVDVELVGLEEDNTMLCKLVI